MHTLRFTSVAIAAVLATACGTGLEVETNTSTQALEDCVVIRDAARDGATRDLVCRRHVDIERADRCARLVDDARTDESLRDRASACLEERDFCVVRDDGAVRDSRCAQPETDRPLDACRRAFNSDDPELQRQAHARCGDDIDRGPSCEDHLLRDAAGDVIRDQICDRPTRPDVDACDRLADGDRNRCYDALDRPHCTVDRVLTDGDVVIREETCSRPDYTDRHMDCAVVVSRAGDGSEVREELCREPTQGRVSDEPADDRNTDDAANTDATDANSDTAGDANGDTAGDANGDTAGDANGDSTGDRR